MWPNDVQLRLLSSFQPLEATARKAWSLVLCVCVPTFVPLPVFALKKNFIRRVYPTPHTFHFPWPALGHICSVVAHLLCEFPQHWYEVFFCVYHRASVFCLFCHCSTIFQASGLSPQRSQFWHRVKSPGIPVTLARIGTVITLSIKPLPKTDISSSLFRPCSQRFSSADQRWHGLPTGSLACASTSSLCSQCSACSVWLDSAGATVLVQCSCHTASSHGLPTKRFLGIQAICMFRVRGALRTFIFSASCDVLGTAWKGSTVAALSSLLSTIAQLMTRSPDVHE